MSSNLAGQTVVVVGGSSGIGYGVAKASLLNRAAQVIIASSSAEKVDDAIKRLQADVAGAAVEGKLSGGVLNAKDSASVKAFFDNLGEIDHLVWSSGDPLRLGYSGMDLDVNKDAFDVRFWGAAAAAKAAKLRKGGSVTLTVGTVVVKPRPQWSLAAAVMGAVDGFTRGLAVDIAPTRVNCVSPGFVKTELWNNFSPEARQKMFDDAAESLLVRHVADADEIAEAYMFVMKCKYITGQRIEVDGGFKYL